MVSKGFISKKRLELILMVQAYRDLVVAEHYFHAAPGTITELRDWRERTYAYFKAAVKLDPLNSARADVSTSVAGFESIISFKVLPEMLETVPDENGLIWYDLAPAAPDPHNEFRAADAFEYVAAVHYGRNGRAAVATRLNALSEQIAALQESGQPVPSYLLAAYRGYERFQTGPHKDQGIVKLNDALPWLSPER